MDIHQLFIRIFKVVQTEAPVDDKINVTKKLIFLQGMAENTLG